MPLKNIALTCHYRAYDTDANAPKTGDAGNHSLRVVKDGVGAAATNTPAEVDATNAPGLYSLSLTASEMNANSISVAGKSSTANVVILGVDLVTEQGRLDENVSAAKTLTSSEHTNIATDTRTGLSAQGYTNARAGYLDTLNGLVAAIWAAAVDSSGVVTLLNRLSALRAVKLDNLDNLDATVSSRLAGSAYTAPPPASDIATAVWAAGTRTLTSFGTLVADIWNHATALAIAAKTALIGTAQFTVTSPVTAAGLVEIVQGVDYAIADGTSIDFTLSGPLIAELRDHLTTVEFIADKRARLAVEATISNLDVDGSDGLLVQVELTAEQSAGLEFKPQSFYLQGTLDPGHASRKLPPLAKGSLIVERGGE